MRFDGPVVKRPVVDVFRPAPNREICRRSISSTSTDANIDAQDNTTIPFHAEVRVKNHYAVEVIATVGLLAFIAVGLANARREQVDVFVEGFHHMPSRFLVTEYHIGAGVGGSVWFDGGGGDINCCIRLPRRWRSGLLADVRWVVWDWSHSSEDDVKNLRFEGARLEGIYRTQVPIEIYDEASNLDVHFFSGGRVRLSSSKYRPDNPQNPVRKEGATAALRATQGIKIREVFSRKEIAEQIREAAEYRKSHGDWR